MKRHEIGRAVTAWAEREPAVLALVLIGSRARAVDEPAMAADEFSDWDFQVVTSRPELFTTATWMSGLGLGEPLAYVARLGRLGTATKISALLREGEMDLVVIPAARLKRAKILLSLGLAPRFATLRDALGGLAVVLRGGHRLLKGEREWAGFFRRIAHEFPVPRLGDAMVRSLAEGFVCDYVSTRNKIERGELLAAQRWLHLQMAEVNFQLLHELRQRRGEPSLPDARRIERFPGASRRVEVRALPSAENLRLATEESAAALRELMSELGPDWRWPL